MEKIEKHFNDYDCYATEKQNGNYNLGIYSDSRCIFEKEVSKDALEEILTDYYNVHMTVISAYIRYEKDNSMSPTDCKFFK